MTTTVTTPVPDVDPYRWPDVARCPRAPARARIARTLLHRAAGVAGIRVTEPGARLRDDDAGGAARIPSLSVRRPDEFYSRLGRDGLIGLGEGWMSGAWDSDDLPAVLLALAKRLTELVPAPLHRLRRVVHPRTPDDERGDRRGARDNVARHYDLSNELFATFLDPTMTYSSALFDAGDDLERAQLRKIDAVLDAAGVRDGSEVLEIGTGWGALAIRGAQRGARVTTVTLSEQQRTEATRRVDAAGLSERVTVDLRDYRDVTGSYDAVVSVEMIEAVGERHWPDYFAALGRLLRPGGRVGLQAITMPHDHMRATRNSWTWIHKYIFPGGLIPSARAITEHAARDGGLQVLHRRAFGLHYAETLREWRERFTDAADDLPELGFDHVFQRMWEFYLAYCEAGFRAGRLDVEQFALGAEGVR